jgi:hypothetical protein
MKWTNEQTSTENWKNETHEGENWNILRKTCPSTFCMLIKRRVGDKQHPCLTPLIISTAFPISDSSIYIAIFIFRYKICTTFIKCGGKPVSHYLWKFMSDNFVLSVQESTLSW